MFDSMMGAEVVEIISLPSLLLRLGTKGRINPIIAMMATKINPILSWRITRKRDLVSEFELDD